MCVYHWLKVFRYTDQFQLIRVNNTIAFTWLSTPPESAAVCMAWQAFLSSSFTVVYFTIEAVLMMRGQMMSLFIPSQWRTFFSVYYLYNCSTRVKNWLITQVSIEILLLAALKARGYGVVDYGPSCYAYNTWSPIVFGPWVFFPFFFFKFQKFELIPSE